MFEMIKYMIMSKKGQFSNLREILIGLAIAAVLIGIIIFYIVPNLSAQASNVDGTLGILK